MAEIHRDSFGFPSERRLRKRREYLRVQRRGKKLWGRRFIYYLSRPTTSVTRLGITASRKVGNAVTRNRIKRWVREVYRQNPQLFPLPVDVVVIAKRGIDDFSYRAIEEEFTHVFRRYFEEKTASRTGRRR